MLHIETHEVSNSVPPLVGYNAFEVDYLLNALLQSKLPKSACQQLSVYGQHVGGQLIELGRLANFYPPQLHQFDNFGHRVDWVEYQEAYHQIIQTAVHHGLHSIPWENQHQGYGHKLRAGLMYLHSQAEAGSACPLSMTYAAMPVVSQISSSLKTQIIEKLTTRTYDNEQKPFTQKTGMLIGMSMTEKQGGSDVKGNQTIAVANENHYEITGHKWFCSAPMSDAFLMTAQTKEGISCFFVPRVREDGQRNSIYLQRLKNKLGNKSNASSEIELKKCIGYLVGNPGQGIKTIMDMVVLTRFDCMVGSASIMRSALLQACHHAKHRQAFGKILINQPLMRTVLADCQLEMTGILHFCFRLADALDQTENTNEKHLLRVLTAVGKYWICKTAPLFINEAQECLGGLGYIEDCILPRLYREAPLNSIWEGCGNIQCLDILRILQKSPESFEILLNELDSCLGHWPEYDRVLNSLKNSLLQKEILPNQLRIIVQQIFHLFTASVLSSEYATVAQIYVKTRLKQSNSRFFGENLEVQDLNPLLKTLTETTSVY